MQWSLKTSIFNMRMLAELNQTLFTFREDKLFGKLPLTNNNMLPFLLILMLVFGSKVKIGFITKNHKLN